MDRVRTRRQGRLEPTEDQVTAEDGATGGQEVHPSDFPSEGATQVVREKVHAEVHQGPEDRIRFQVAEDPVDQ